MKARRDRFGLAALALAVGLMVAALAGGAQAALASTPAGASIVGKWAGTVKQPGIASFRLKLTVRSPVKTHAGQVAIPGSKCSGTIRFMAVRSGRYVFKMTWQKGNCINGTASLRALGKKRLSYLWAGKYSDGTKASSSATLLRAA